MRIAFYAPMKPPDHPVPSGDREMARNLIGAMTRRGHTVTLASHFAAWSARPSGGRMAELRQAATPERARIAAQWRADGAAPDIWLTYHPYYKSPDFLGPALCRDARVPYVCVEASCAGKRDRDDWAPFQAEVVSGLRQAEAVFAMTAQDEEGLRRALGEAANVPRLPPFIDTARFAAPAVAGAAPQSAAPRLICVAMMRAGAKAKSYLFLAEALKGVAHLPWRLTIVGDGPERGAIEAAFAGFDRGRVDWRGAAPVEAIPALLARADIYVWPGFEEAYGVAYLEAQAAGLPVVALDCGGVADALRAGETGLLVGETSAAAYGRAVARLIADSALRKTMGAAARRFVFAERSLSGAGARLDAAFAAARRAP